MSEAMLVQSLERPPACPACGGPGVPLGRPTTGVPVMGYGCRVCRTLYTWNWDTGQVVRDG